jgi:hypothetical protein
MAPSTEVHMANSDPPEEDPVWCSAGEFASQKTNQEKEYISEILETRKTPPHQAEVKGP